jgi:hypothetical protein
MLHLVGARQVVTEQSADPEVLFVTGILTTCERQAAELLQDRVASLAHLAARFLGADLALARYCRWQAAFAQRQS